MNEYESRKLRRQSYESLAVDASGNAWIQVSHYGRSYLATPENFPFRTLEGEPLVSPQHDFWINESVLPSFNKDDWRTGSLATNWGRRVNQITNTGKEIWYLVHNGQAAKGKAYLVGYDLVSKLPVGYCGRQGFRLELPEENDWFRIHSSAVGYGQGSLATLSNRRNPQISLATADGWYVFDVQQRAFRAFDDSQPYMSVGICNITESALDNTGDKALDEAELEELQEQLKNFTPSWPEAFVARNTDHILVQNPDANEPWKFVIPESYRDLRISFYFLSQDRALLNTFEGSGLDQESELTWINAAGEVDQTKTLQWNRYRGSSGRETSTVVSTVMPLPAAMGTMIMGILPFTANMPNYPTWKQSGYRERLQLLLADGWPPFLTLGIISAVLTWLTTCWHRKYSRPHTGAWATFVFLLGAPGFAAYWAYHMRPPLEPCPDCGDKIPRNRDACAHCQQPLPEPRLLGTEVFA